MVNDMSYYMDALQVNDNTSTAGSPGEVLSRRCVNLLKTALRPDMWSKSELKLQWFDKLLMTVVGHPWWGPLRLHQMVLLGP
jgi:hypothetical protein